jgi:hypothetical protein
MSDHIITTGYDVYKYTSMQFRRHRGQGIAAYLPVAELYPYASTVQADSGGEGRVKNLQEKRAYIRFY